jgi:MFS family permease
MEHPARPALLTPAFLLASAAHFLHALAWHLHLHLPGFLKGLGASEVRIGLIFGTTAVTAIATRPLLGRVMDTRGRRGVLLAGGVIASAVCALYLTVGSLGPGIWALRIAHGIGESMLFASLFAYAADIVPPSRRIEGIALFGVSGMIPMGLGGLLGDWLLPQGGYPLLFAVSTGLAVLALLLSVPLREPPRHAGEPPRGVLAAIAQPNLLPIWFVGIVFASGLAAHVTFIKTYVLATGLGTVGGFFGAYSASAVLLRLLFGSVPERIGPKRALFPAMASLVLGFVLLSTTRHDLGVLAAGVLCGLGHGFTFPILLGLVLARARASERGASLAIYTALFDAGTLVGGPLLGLVITGFGYRAMFATAAVAVTLGVLVFAAWDRDH